MKVLVSGGAGFIGSHLVERLLAARHDVVVLDNFSTGRRDNLPMGDTRLRVVEGDIRDRAEVAAAVRGVDAIVHLAAVASVQASMDDPVGTHGSNFDGTLHLLEAARAEGTGRFVYASSAAVYGDTTVLPVPEDTPPSPLSPYAADKLAGEYYLRHFATHCGVNATGFRFFNIFGPRQDPSSPYSGVISIFVERLRRGEGVVVFGDGEQTRDFTYVGDVAAVLAQALERTDWSTKVFNLGTGKETSLRALIASLERLSGRKLPATCTEARAGDIRQSVSDVHRLNAAWPTRPITPFDEGLAALLRHEGLGLGE